MITSTTLVVETLNFEKFFLLVVGEKITIKQQ